MRYHAELIKVVTNEFSAFCRIYSIDNLGTIRQVLNIRVSYFHTGKTIIVDSPDNYCRLSMKDGNLSIIGLATNEIIMSVNSLRTTSFNSHESSGGDVRAKTSIIERGLLTEKEEFIINLENRKLKSIIL